MEHPSALISGGTAAFLSRLLRSPNIRRVLDRPPAWVNRADVAVTVDAIHEAGRAWETSITLQQRDNAVALGAAVQCWTTKRAAEHLRMSQRRVQELASELGGKRIGREWRIPATMVREYAKRRNTA